MKKIALISTLAVLASAGAAQATTKYNGFYVGVGPSYNMMKNKHQTNFTEIASPYSKEVHKVNASGDQAGCYVYAGYGTTVVNPVTYLGLEFTGNFGDVKSRFTQDLLSTHDGFIADYKKKSSWSAAMRVGLLARGGLYYVSLGAETSQFNYRYLDKTTVNGAMQPDWSKSFKKTSTGFASGLGYETTLWNQNTKFRMQYNVTVYNRWNTSPYTRNDGVAAPASFWSKNRTTVGSFMVGVSHYFNHHK